MLEWLINLDKELLLLLNGQQHYFWDYLMRLISEKEMWYVFYIVLIGCIFNTYGWRKGGFDSYQFGFGNRSKRSNSFWNF